MPPEKNVASKKEKQTKLHFPFQLHPLHNMETCLKELGGRTKSHSRFVEQRLDPTTLSVVSDQLAKWKLEHPSIQAGSTLFNDFLKNVILKDHRVREINQQRWSQLQTEGQNVTWEEFKLYTQYVWGQWARQKSKGIKRTQDALKAPPVAHGKPVPPPVSTPQKEPTTRRKRVEQVEEQTMTHPSSTKKSAEVHESKRSVNPATEPLTPVKSSSRTTISIIPPPVKHAGADNLMYEMSKAISSCTIPITKPLVKSTAPSTSSGSTPITNNCIDSASQLTRKRRRLITYDSDDDDVPILELEGIPRLKKRRAEIQRENLELEKEVTRLKESDVKQEREIRAKLKRKIDGELQRNRELKRQVEVLKTVYLDEELSD